MQELIKAPRNSLQDSVNEKVRDLTADQSLSKLFEPLTEKIETKTKAIESITLPGQANAVT